MAHVLYLDDDPTLVMLASSMLEHLGHRVSAFTDSAEALAAFKAGPHQFDLLLTDMSMFGMSGLEFALQALEIRPDVAIGITTGCVDPNWSSHALAAGVRAVIDKPMTLDEMAKAMTRLMG